MAFRDFVRPGRDMTRKNKELVRQGSDRAILSYPVPPFTGHYNQDVDSRIRDASNFYTNAVLYPLVETAGIDYLKMSDVRSGTTDFEVTSNYLSVDDAGTKVGLLRNQYIQLVDE